ncbi:MAG: LacI family DNA-binding transcriptional regulator, partial [Eubacteriales bacterium]|nr:LacI family DNA-binding transcriptional regulator [Eubacteriales bacterium]
MISIREVAKLAGVSASTVSRVLNGTARVDEEKEKRIRKVIEETGYVPNEVARSLFKRSSKLIGLIVPNIENPFFSQLAKAMEDAAYRKGYRILLCNTNEIHNKEFDSIQILTQMNADGVIITTTDVELHFEAQKCPLPVVIMDRQVEGIEGLSYVMADHYIGGRMAMEHMIECGCKHIVNIKGPQRYSS